MYTGKDESSSGVNGRLRPRKSTVPSPQSNKIVRKSDGKTAQDRPKRTSTPSKASSTKPDDLIAKSESTTIQILCTYCDRKFASKQAISKHVRRIHFSSSKQTSVFSCLLCKHTVPDSNDIIRHMVDSHPNQYFACLDCHTRFPSTSELAEHKLTVCEKHKVSYRNKLRQKTSSVAKKNQKSSNLDDKDNMDINESNRFNGIVISCELKPSQVIDNADIEDNITTNLILPPSKNLVTNAEIEKNAVIVLDDLQWSKRMPANFSFHNSDADQILSRLGVVHRSPRTSEFTKKDWLRNIDESTQKFEKCFDTSFYAKVASNVQENLSKFLDGSFNFNPDADSTIKTRKLKNSVVINTAEGFPILLACDQFLRSTFDGYMPRTIAPKHKWKWDNEKSPLNPDDIKRDSHVNNCIITLVSSLDIWTQLCMRRKFEDKFSIAPLEKKTEKQNAISKELKEILESREIPSTSSNTVQYASKPSPSVEAADFPASLGLRPAAPTYDLQPAVLSGEWVRPRCYVCCACGAQTRDSRGLSSHITTYHPNAQVQHYEIVGELLLNADILKHLYVPPSVPSNRTRPLRGFRECTKCKKSISLEDLHQHMLDCAGDTPTVRRKCRYRPFGVRRRRPRLPDNTIRKKIRKDIRRQTRQTRQKNLVRPRPKIRTEVGDAESIRKMIADLPAKRHRAIVTPTNPIVRPRKKIEQQRNKLVLKRRTTQRTFNQSDVQQDESAQTRKQERNRYLNNRLRSSPSNEDNDDKSSKDDDDKPLKPRLKRLVAKSARQSESLKRKVALNRAKRRAQFKEQSTAHEEKEPNSVGKTPVETAAVSGNSSEQLSIGNTPQKIDINNSPYNTREHSSRNRNNNSNDQERSGSSRQNGNENNTFVPTPNEPLKHSIARLTSDTEKCDKTLQLHQQIYLSQQECNNQNQHLAVGEQQLFENEAVVTKLDKPPLHFQQQGTTDSISYHKNKLIKRKGLNDCIAMLRNKLVDPIIPTPPMHSIEYGIDDRLIGQSVMDNQRLSSAEYQAQINTRPAEVFSRHNYIQERLFHLRNESNLIHEGLDDIPQQLLAAQKLFELPPRRSNKIEKVRPPKQRQSAPKRESTRRRSTRTERDNTRDKYVLPPHIELMPYYTALESCTLKLSPHCNLDIYQNLLNDLKNDPNKYNSNQPCISSAVPKKQAHGRYELDPGSGSSLDVQSRRLSDETQLLEMAQAEAIDLPKLKQTETGLRSSPKQMELCAQSQLTELHTYKHTLIKQTEPYTQSQQKTTESFIIPLQRQSDFYSQTQLNKSEACTLSQLNISDAYSQSQVKQSEIYTQCQLKPAETYTQSQLKRTEAYTQSELKQTDVYSQSQVKQTEVHSQSHQKPVDVNTQSQPNPTEVYSQTQAKPADVYSQPLLHQAETYIQSPVASQKPATAYTDSPFNQNIQDAFPDREVPRIIITHDRYSENIFNLSGISLISTNSNSSDLDPLDLSVNTDSSSASTKLSCSYETNEYDSYETLDLSNKSVEHIREDLVVDDVIDCVVDLRVRNSQKSEIDVKLSSGNDDMESATDLTIKAMEMENVPTDLTVRRKNAIYEYEQLNINYECVQDLSKYGKDNCDEQPQLLSITEDIVNQELPTDLSGKKTKNTMLIISEPADNELCVDEDITSVEPADLSARRDVKNLRSEQEERRFTPEVENIEHNIDVEKSQDSYDTNELQSYINKNQDHFKGDIQTISRIDPNCKSGQMFDSSIIEHPKPMFNYNDSQIHSVSLASQVIEAAKSFDTNKIRQADDSCVEKSENMLITQSDITLPLYTLSNTTNNNPRRKFESTMPVYTLANVCISMSKIESASVVSNVESTFDIHGTTVTKSAPHCTLTETLTLEKCTIEGKVRDASVKVKESPQLERSCNETGIQTQKTISNTIATTASVIATSVDQAITIEKCSKEGDIDPETAKKIALLPKELVEILGTMPVDHRNQLLNVLPHYVSKSPAAVQSKDSSIMPVTFCTSVEPSTCQTTVSTHIISPENKYKNDEIKPHPIEMNRSNTYGSYVPVIDQIRIIDLTVDESHMESKVTKNSEEISGVVTVTTEQSAITKPNKTKANDQTASLRAVRIKAPSERNKPMYEEKRQIENHILKATVEQQIKINVTAVQDLQVIVEKCSNLDKTMAIQQAEVSSTQHNTTSSGKYPLATSPASTESSSDETCKNMSQSVSITTIGMDKEQNKDPNVYNIPLPKSKVSSSISSKERNLYDMESTVKEHSLKTSAAVGPPIQDLECETQLNITKKVLNSSSMETAIESVGSGCMTEPTNAISAVELSSLEQEDSEDDISLAAIVKQKQRNLKKNEKAIGIAEVGNKKKRSKKAKKCGRQALRALDEHLLCKQSLEIQSNSITLTKAHVNEVSEMLLTNQADDQVQITLQSETAKEKIELEDITNGCNKYNSDVPNIKKDFIRQSKSKEHTDNLIVQEMAQVDKSCSNKDPESDNVVEVTSDINIKKGRGKNKLDSKTLEFTDVSKKDKVKLKESNMKEIETTVCKKRESVGNSETLENTISTSGNSCNYVTTSTAVSVSKDFDDTRHASDICNAPLDSPHKNSTEKRVDIIIPSPDRVSPLLQDADSKDNLLLTPVRRSRRGKSLFMESNSVPKEITNTSEIVIEHKTPLTKKQLIFSKLLLDEAKPEEPTHLFTEKVDLDKTEIMKDDMGVNPNSNIVSSCPEIDKSLNIFEKSKANKRRLSPNSSRKSKKKKSFEDNQIKSYDIIDTMITKDLILIDGSVPNSTISNDEHKPRLSIDKVEDQSITIERNVLDLPITKDNIVSDRSINAESNSKIDEKFSASEKRKMNNQLSSDLSKSSKPKKSKTIKGEEIDQEQPKNEVTVIEKEVVPSPASAPRTACYNITVPARRGRSKSVVVKSSGADMYDPYNIDLEDMIEQHESFRRKKKASEQKPGVTQKKSKIIVIPTIDNIKGNSEKEITKVVENIESNKTTMSDSDDSSKSDVPLQKYVEDKEKKSLELGITSTQIKSDAQNLKVCKNDSSKDMKSVEPTLGNPISTAENEAEQKLRSEQFMESFGFFSERKPRKSNLLATKKISETFNTTNESDDKYFGFKERSSKKSLLHHDKDIKKTVDAELPKLPQPSTSKKVAKRGRKKKNCTKILPSYCKVCKKEFRRPDNYLRHQMTLLHISKLSEVEMKVKTAPVHEEPNYLMAYKQYLERFSKLNDKLFKLKRRNPNAASKIVLPTMQEILSDVNRAVRAQQLSQRGLSHDEELFIDCCELLKDGDKANTSSASSSMSGLDILENAINASFAIDCESEENYVDIITAQNILDSEEVRNLENDLISGLKEAAKATRKTCNIEYQSSIGKMPRELENLHDICSSNNDAESNYEIADYDIPEKPRSSKAKKHYSSSTEFIQIKEKMYPDVIEDIDMFEDKFDKIKRKCRSQAAAAKQTPPIVESCISHKARRKSDKKKGKKNTKKTRHQSTQVPTKGALKGFDGIKVSIPTSDINLSALVPVAESPPKKKKKISSKKKRDKKDSESSSKYDSDHHGKDSNHIKKIDVYEFMDNEDAELFEFRPSTLMERFKSISNKETPSTSKFTAAVEDNSSESGSDGDDFVYMSDDYVCSDDETENSLLSCENGNVKLGIDAKKMVVPQKRKDVVEKNAVMGKIFKHNAVRTEKKISIPKEPVKPKANLDQLFDSLLEEDPNTLNLNSELDSPCKDEESSLKTAAALRYDSNLGNDLDGSDVEKLSCLKKTAPLSPDKIEYDTAATSKRRSSSSSKDPPILSKKHISDVDHKLPEQKKLDTPSTSFLEYGPSTSKKYESQLDEDYRHMSPKRCNLVSVKKNETLLPKHNETKLPEHGEASTSKHDETITDSCKNFKLSSKKDRSISSSFEYSADAYDQSVFDEAGVARQRARRKCTVGKQNVLAESWSSESEPDGGPQRPNSAESIVTGSGRKKKGRKKDGQNSGGRRGNKSQITFKRYDIESRVNSSNRNTSSNVSSGVHGGPVDDGEIPGPSGLGSGAAVASTSAAAAATAAADAAAAAAEAEAEAAAAMPAPSTSQAPSTGQKGRPRSVAYYWSSEGDDEQEHQQQHGWIVGDSHKKLVTMLAHAKGRKRNNDDKRHLVE